jgi:UDP-glucuronate 4-epimerase
VRLLLTGGAGFIGSSCLAAWLERGDQVTVVDSFEATLYDRATKEANLAWARGRGAFDFAEIDLRDRAALDRVMAAAAPERVVHMAAVAGVRQSIAAAPHTFDVNVTGTAQLLAAGRAAGVREFVLASSSSVYGGNVKTPFAEDDPVGRPISPYAASKRAMELMARADQHLHGGHITCLRLFTVYGPRQRPEMAFHKFMRLIDGGAPVPMFGDGSTGRDYTYVGDIVQGVTRALGALDGFRIYNLGSDRVVRLADAIALIAEVVGKPARIAPLPAQPGDVDLTSADLTRSRAELGYAPKTDLRAGLEAMWAWYQSK